MYKHVNSSPFSGGGRGKKAEKNYRMRHEEKRRQYLLQLGGKKCKFRFFTGQNNIH